MLSSGEDGGGDRDGGDGRGTGRDHVEMIGLEIAEKMAEVETRVGVSLVMVVMTSENGPGEKGSMAVGRKT